MSVCLRTFSGHEDIPVLSTGQVGSSKVLTLQGQLSTHYEQEQADGWPPSSPLRCDNSTASFTISQQSAAGLSPSLHKQELAPNAPDTVAFPSLPQFHTPIPRLPEVNPQICHYPEVLASGRIQPGTEIIYVLPPLGDSQHRLVYCNP